MGDGETVMDWTDIDAEVRASRHYGGNGHDSEDPPFRVVDMAALHRTDTPQTWVWDGYIPHGHVTLLSGHGGAGKSTLALQVAACVAMGRPVLGRATERTRVLFVSAEDPADLVLRRLRVICRCLGLPFDEVAEWLQVIDMTEGQPVLYKEQRMDGVRHGVTTLAYDAISEYVQREGFGLVVVDNASDTFDADEINRALVRGFIRSLRAWASHGGAVLLLSHVDKATSKSAGKEAYSGSTAWHNSVRSRLFLVQKEPGKLDLQHQKCNVGPELRTLPLVWPTDEVMQVEVVGGFVAQLESKNDKRALLELIHEFYGRGEWISPSTKSRNHAGLLLVGQKGFPGHLKSADVANVLRDAEREKLLRREEFKDKYRKGHDRWAVTETGLEFIGAACAAGAVSG